MVEGERHGQSMKNNVRGVHVNTQGEISQALPPVNQPLPSCFWESRGFRRTAPWVNKVDYGENGNSAYLNPTLISFRLGPSAIWDVSSRYQRAFLCQLKVSHTESTSWTFEMSGDQEWNLGNCSSFSFTSMRSSTCSLLRGAWDCRGVSGHLDLPALTRSTQGCFWEMKSFAQCLFVVGICHSCWTTQILSTALVPLGNLTTKWVNFNCILQGIYLFLAIIFGVAETKASEN